MKAAYVKLRQLIDAGCVFIGHGLKKDFEMINVVIPPAQVLDTVELFYRYLYRRMCVRLQMDREKGRTPLETLLHVSFQ